MTRTCSKEEPVKKEPEKNKRGNALKVQRTSSIAGQSTGGKTLEHELTVVEKNPFQPIVEEKPEEPVPTTRCRDTAGKPPNPFVHLRLLYRILLA